MPQKFHKIRELGVVTALQYNLLRTIGYVLSDIRPTIHQDLQNTKPNLMTDSGHTSFTTYSWLIFYYVS